MKQWLYKLAGAITILSTLFFLLGVSPAFASTLGYTTQGGSTLGFVGGRVYCYGVVAPSNGTINDIQANVSAAAGKTFSLKPIVTDQAGPNILTNGIGNASGVIGNTSKHWETLTYTTGPTIVSGQSYYLCVIDNAATFGDGLLSQDNLGGTPGWEDTTPNSYASPTSPLGGGLFSLSASIYADYTPSGSAVTHTLLVQTKGKVVHNKGTFIIQ